MKVNVMFQSMFVQCDIGMVERVKGFVDVFKAYAKSSAKAKQEAPKLFPLAERYE